MVQLITFWSQNGAHGGGSLRSKTETMEATYKGVYDGKELCDPIQKAMSIEDLRILEFRPNREIPQSEEDNIRMSIVISLSSPQPWSA